LPEVKYAVALAISNNKYHIVLVMWNTWLSCKVYGMANFLYYDILLYYRGAKVKLVYSILVIAEIRM